MRWRSYTSDGYEKLLKGSVLPLVPAVKLLNSANQSIPSVTTTVLTFDTEEFDTDGMHDPATNPSRITIRTAGKYQVRACAIFAAGATGIRDLYIRKNGGGSYLSIDRVLPAAATASYMEASVVLDLAVGDYIEASLYQDSGGALNSLFGTGHAPCLEAVYVGPSIMSDGGIGERELSYTERTTTLALAASSEAAAATWIDTGSLTFDGKTTIEIEVYAPAWDANAATARVNIWDGATNLGILTQLGVSAAALNSTVLIGKRRLTPTAGAHNFIAKAWLSAGTVGNIYGGVAGIGAVVPAFVRIKRVS